MKNVKILDCSLRDGGRVIDCAFPDTNILGICNGLTDAKIDIVEMGFLRSGVEYKGNSTFFTEIDQFERFIPKDRGNTEFVAFADYGKEFHMWDFSKIVPCSGKSVTGFRVGYRKKDLHNALETFEIVKDNGYKLFIQGVESLNYTDREMLETIDIINRVKPYSFGIVDTYGAMYKDDVLRLFGMLDHNLDDQIAIDFHSHNNLQLSFSFAQEVVEASRGKRTIILDATMEGLGKGIGNLNTELITDYLNRKHGYLYENAALFDTIDEYVDWIKEEHSWAYSIPYFMAGIYSSHANNISYLQDKHRLNTKDLTKIISMIEPDKRKRYDYENLERIYREYFGSEIDDRAARAALSKLVKGKKVLVLVPGATLNKYAESVEAAAHQDGTVVISVNFPYTKAENSYAFFGNQRRYNRNRMQGVQQKCLLTSNVASEDESDLVFNYNRLIDTDAKYVENSAMMLLRLLRSVDVQDIDIAGFDGFGGPDGSNYFESGYDSRHKNEDYERLNTDISSQLKRFARTLDRRESVRFITPSMFAPLFERK